MRLLAIATVFLATSPFVQAQDAASAPFPRTGPSPTEESARTSTPGAGATLTPEPAETFTLQPMTTPTLEPIASPLPKPTATAKPRPTPTPQPTPIPVEPPAVDQNQGDIASKLKAFEERWEGSFMTHDISVIEQLVAEDFVGTSSSGKLGNKSTMISEARKDKNVYRSVVSEDIVVHSFGPNIAVVTGLAREAGKTPSGKAFSHAYRFTDTWVERNGEWQCVAASAMVIPKKK